MEMESKNDSDSKKTIYEIMADEFVSKLINAKNLGREFLCMFEVVKEQNEE